MPNTGNNIELLVKLGIDKSNKTDLQTQVDQLGKTLSGLKVNINIDQKAISALEKLSTMDFSKLSSSVQKTTKEVENIAVKSAKEVQDSIKKASDALGMNFSKAAQSGFKDVEQIKKELKSLSPNIKVDFDVVDGKKQLDKIKASFERDGITTTIKFQKSTLSDNGSDSSIWMPDKIQENNKQMSLAAKNVDELVKKMNKLQTEGKISNEQFEKLTSSISNIDKNGGIKGLNAQLDQFVVNNKKAEQAVRDQAKAQKEQEAELKRQEQAQKRIIENEIKRKNLIIDIERAMKSQGRTLDSGAARNLIESTKQLDISSKNFGTSLKQNQSALKQLRADATEATRSNIGIVEAFQTAFTKFPIWMAASTAFFGVIRTAKEFGSIILDIDTKMTNLAKVMNDDADLEGVFDRATQSAERFGQSISQALDAYTEFARQGYKADELGMLADAGLVASNVGEITAQQASEYMTASLIQWKKDASEAMGIIDSWNEISNNYATTTEKLAQGQARAGATARAMGLDFDQLNAIVGTVTATTKQSGKLHCPSAQRCA